MILYKLNRMLNTFTCTVAAQKNVCVQYTLLDVSNSMSKLWHNDFLWCITIINKWKTKSANESNTLIIQWTKEEVKEEKKCRNCNVFHKRDRKYCQAWERRKTSHTFPHTYKYIQRTRIHFFLLLYTFIEPYIH